MSSQIPPEYSDAYERAYRSSLAEHPTELLAAARPGKRASKPATRLGSWRAGAEELIIDVVANATYRRVAVGSASVVVLLVAYGLGRMFS